MNLFRQITVSLITLLLSHSAVAEKQGDVSQMKNRKQQLEQEAADIRSEIEADKARLEKLQKLIDELNAQNANMDQQLQSEIQELK